MAHPAGERALEGRVPPPRDERERGRARAAVEVLVAAAHGEIGLAAVEVHGHGARAVGEVPEREGAGVVRRPRQARHVVDLAGAEVHVGEQEHGDVVPERGAEPVARDEAQLDVAQQAREALRDVEVGGEVRLLGEDHAPAGSQAQGPRQELEDVDGGRVGHRHLVGRGPDERREEPRHSGREVDPAVLVPAPDEVLAPLALGDLAEAFHGPAGQGAERIAVEVDDPFRQDERLAQKSQVVPGVERLGVGAGERRDPGHTRDVTAVGRDPGERW